MDPIYIGLIGVIAFLVLILIGTWIGYAAALVGVVGMISLRGFGATSSIIGDLSYSSIASFELSVIPMFIIMGYFAYYGGITRDIFRVCGNWFGHYPGGLGIATTYGSAIFGALSGSSTAAAAVMGQLTIPEMLEKKYSPRLASGTVAAGGTLAAIIPPSVIMVIYGVIAQVSVGTLLVAGIVPGIIQATAFAVVVYIWCRINPSAGPPMHRVSWRKRLSSLKQIWSAILLGFIVMGGLYGGIFTPTEAGGIGAAGALIIGVATRRLSWVGFKKSVLETTKTTAMIFMILIGVYFLLNFLALSGLSRLAVNTAIDSNFSPVMMLSGILAIMAVLGMFVSATGMIMLTVPFAMPVLLASGFDPIWFGVIVVMMCEIAFITPPVAMNLYAVKSVIPSLDLNDIMLGIMPFLLVSCLVIVLFIIFPDIILWMPSSMTR